MTQKKLIQIIKDVQKAVADIPNLNYGGCGVFAQAVYEGLKSIGIKSVLWSANPTKTESRFKGNCHPLELQGHCGHVICAAKIKGKILLFDSEHIIWFENAQGEFPFKDSQYYLSESPLPKKSFKQLVEDKDCWNWMFDRKSYKTKIEKRVKNILTT